MTNALYTLTEEEKIRLASHEEVIDNGLNTFHKVGMALLDIRDNRLYRQNHRTFESYCQERWGMERRHAYRLMDAAQVVENVSNWTQSPPTNEAQARPLTPLEPEQQTLVWQVVEKTAPNGKVTNDHVKSVVNVLKDVVRTGAIDNGEGVDIPVETAGVDHLKAAIVEETYERMKRQELHIEEKMARKNGLDPLMTSDSYEWYTPEHIARKAFDFLGGIELDPASSAAANAVIKAQRFFSVLDNGLEQSWTATAVWMNPPYGRELPLWIEKLVSEYEAGHIMEALALVPARPDTAWFKRLRDYPRCFIDGRLKFGGTGTDNSAPFPSMLVYLGKRERDFVALWSSLGDIYVRVTL